jgi:serine/threonine protein kinase
MLATANMVKIMDFGIAKSALQLTKTTEGFTKGTPMYMSPEQVAGDPLTPASDIYTLGIVLYEMLTGARLFAVDNLMQVIEKVSRSDVADDLDRHAGVLDPVMPVLECALARDPGERYATAQALLEALEDLRMRVPAGRSVASLVDRYRKQEPLARPPKAGGSHAEQAHANAWSVVMPNLGPDGLLDEEAATVTIEIDEDGD